MESSQDDAAKSEEDQKDNSLKQPLMQTEFNKTKLLKKKLSNFSGFSNQNRKAKSQGNRMSLKENSKELSALIPTEKKTVQINSFQDFQKMENSKMEHKLSISDQKSDKSRKQHFSIIFMNHFKNFIDLQENELGQGSDPNFLKDEQYKKEFSNFNLEDMNKLLEQCCVNPLKQVNYIATLFKGLNYILTINESYSKIFQIDSDDYHQYEQFNQLIEYFLNNSLILIENQERIRRSLLGIIANLSIIDFPKNPEYPFMQSFGVKCMKLFKELLQQKNELNILAMEILQIIAVPYVLQEYIEDVHFPILHGLILIAKDCDISFLIQENQQLWVEKTMRWIKQIDERSISKEFQAKSNLALELIAQFMKDKNYSKKFCDLIPIFEILDLLGKTIQFSQEKIIIQMKNQNIFQKRQIELYKILEKFLKITYDEDEKVQDIITKTLYDQVDMYLIEYIKLNNDFTQKVYPHLDSQEELYEQVLIEYERFSQII